MKKIMLFVLGVLILSGCVNKEMVSYYENSKAGEKIESYQMDLRIYGTYGEESFSEIVKIDNYKGTQFKINYVSANTPEPEEEPTLEEGVTEEQEGETLLDDPMEGRLPNRFEDNSSYVIDGKMYEMKDNRYEEVDKLLYSNANVYLDPIGLASKVDFLFEEKIVEETYQVYTFKVSTKNMQPILDDGVLNKIKLTEEVDAKLWIDKDERVYKVEYYLKNKDNKDDKVTINASLFRINSINDMSNAIR